MKNDTLIFIVIGIVLFLIINNKNGDSNKKGGSSSNKKGGSSSNKKSGSSSNDGGGSSSNDGGGSGSSSNGIYEEQPIFLYNIKRKAYLNMRGVRKGGEAYSYKNEDSNVLLIIHNNNGDLYDGDEISIKKGNLILTDGGDANRNKTYCENFSDFNKFNTFVVEKDSDDGGIISSSDKVHIKSKSSNKYLMVLGISATFYFHSSDRVDDTLFNIISR